MKNDDHATWLLVDLIFDLVTPAKVFRDYIEQPDFDPEGQLIRAVLRMSKMSTIIALCKLDDVLKDYGKSFTDIPDDLKLQRKLFRAYVLEKKIFTYRSKFVAHNFDAFDTHSYEVGNEIANGIFGETFGTNIEFFNWVSPPLPGPTFEAYHPAFLATRLRDHLLQKKRPAPRVR